ncbi:MAG TPA: bifunctional 2-polyprenyl-6-hydroxyphenol methylase/3-demethylubiquinol 3-O-methyltransferase UbiG [Alphaproteobacteria bacterium]|nr:bifunctional 2-polyprenyl-6-hydroxyphenol methylase/3-demethylubiquinol 3-O-methyltransferase UbiG [Alphaproteobacteria bacterium]
MNTAGTIDKAEIRRFSQIADRWWDPEGPHGPLHRLNPLRLDYIRGQAIRHFKRDPAALTPFAGLSVLDIGCGGGLVAEPLARLGAHVTAVDADPVAIEAARDHARLRGLAVDYRHGAAEALADEGRRFDLVLALEVVEHVADRGAFLAMLGRLVAPSGLAIMSTLNRTWKSLALGIGVAEHLLRWVEPGTHDWRKFVRPSELARGLRAAGFDMVDMTGMVFDPLKGEFRLAKERLAVNYFATASRTA